MNLNAILKYLSKGEKAISFELVQLQTLPPEASPELLILARKFEEVYLVLPRLAYEFLVEYKKLRIAKEGVDPGICVIFVGGGRVNGKPLELTSDLDLFISVENPQASYFHTRDHPYRPIETQVKKELISFFYGLVSKYNLDDMKDLFQIWGWGDILDRLVQQDRKLVPIAIVGTK